MEEFMNSEIWKLVLDLMPSIAAVLATVVSAILAIRKVAVAISEFRQSNELKVNNERLEALLKDNAKLQAMNEKLLVELRRIRPVGWTDDKQNEENK